MDRFHIKIKQYRVVYIVLLIFVCWLTLDMWSWYKLNAQILEYASSGAFGAAFLSCLGMIKFGLEGLRQDNKDD